MGSSEVLSGLKEPHPLVLQGQAPLHLLQESFGKSPRSQVTYPNQGLVPVSLTGTLYLPRHGGCSESYLDWEDLEGKVLGICLLRLNTVNNWTHLYFLSLHMGVPPPGILLTPV